MGKNIHLLALRAGILSPAARLREMIARMIAKDAQSVRPEHSLREALDMDDRDLRDCSCVF